jgi:hypothetical protein
MSFEIPHILSTINMYPNTGGISMTTLRCKKCGNEDEFGASGVMMVGVILDNQGEFSRLADGISHEPQNGESFTPEYCGVCFSPDIVKVSEEPVSV